MTRGAMFPGLAPEVEAAIMHAPVAEWVSTTWAGIALDTPLLVFANRYGGTLDVTTGLAYPRKAERARYEPRARPRGRRIRSRATGCRHARLATVRDADIQSNAERYLDLFAPMLPVIGGGAPWAQCREAVWYWARQFIENTITRIMWWPDVDHLDDDPTVWETQPGTTVPPSDPAPAGPPSPGARWPIADWRARARDAGQPDPGMAEPSRQ